MRIYSGFGGKIVVRRGEGENPKFQIRNPKQNPTTKTINPKQTAELGGKVSEEFWGVGMVFAGFLLFWWLDWWEILSRFWLQLSSQSDTILFAGGTFRIDYR
jgi:hypothetical protein